MRYITPTTFQSSSNTTIITNDTAHHSNQLSPSDDTSANSVHSKGGNASITTPSTFQEFIHTPTFQRSISIMIVVSLVLPLVGVYCILMFHPWIDWIVNEVWSWEDGSLVVNVAGITSDGGAFYNVSLVEKDDEMLSFDMMEDWKQQQREEEDGQCFLSLSLFVEQDGKVDHDEEDYTTYESYERRMPREHNDVSSTFNNDDTDPSSNDFICVNCHALFRIHVDILFEGQEEEEVDDSFAIMDDTATHSSQEEERNWFVTLRDVTHENVPLLYAHMDRPLDLDCDIFSTNTVHGDDHIAHFSRCQSTTMIEVPYTSFSSMSGYNSTNNHEEVMMTNERIILVSLHREWSSRYEDDSLEASLVMMKKRRVVDQWMITIVVPSKDGVGGRGMVHSSSIHSAKLRDVVKSVINVTMDTTRMELESSLIENPSTSSSYMYNVFVAVVVGVLAGSAMLAIAFKFVVPRGDDAEEEEEEEEEDIMTTSEILALQRAIRNSNSPAASHDDDEVESAIQQYESSQGRRSPTAEELEINSAREQSTPTNLSPLFDDAADAEVSSNNDDEVHGNKVEEKFIQEEAEESCGEEVESCAEDDEGSEVEGSVQDPFQDDQRDLDEDETGDEMIGEDEDTPPTSNKSSKWSAIPQLQRNSLDNVDDIIREKCTAGSPLFYSPRFQSNETAPLPHSNTSSLYDSVEHADGTDSSPTMPIEPATILLSKPAESNHPSIECRAEWNEFGAFVQDRDVFNAEDVNKTDDNGALAKCAGDEESMNKDEEDPSLSGVSKRLFVTSKPNTNEVAKASSFNEDFDEVDESMFLPNVNVQAEANASPLNLHDQRNVPVEATASELHRTTMESNPKTTLDASLVNEPTVTCDELAKSVTLPHVDLAEAGEPLVESVVDSQQTTDLSPASPAKKSFAANDTCNKSLSVSSPSKEAHSARKTVNTPPTAPLSSYKEDHSPISRASAVSSTKTSTEKSVAKCDANEALTSATDTVESSNLGKTDLTFAAQQLAPSPSPNRSQHDLSYVNQSLSVSSSPSVTSAPRNSNSPSVGEWSNDESRVRKRRSLPFVSREDTSRFGKENESCNSRTPLSAKATNYSPSSTVAATVAEFAVPRTHNGLAWRAERPVAVPSGIAGQSKRLGGSPAHFEPHCHGSSTEVDESNYEPIDFFSQNDDSERNGSSRSGKRSRASKGNKSRKSRKRKSNVVKKLLATTKTSDKHKPPSGLSSLSQHLNEEMWQHSQTSDKC